MFYKHLSNMCTFDIEYILQECNKLIKDKYYSNRILKLISGNKQLRDLVLGKLETEGIYTICNLYIQKKYSEIFRLLEKTSSFENKFKELVTKKITNLTELYYIFKNKIDKKISQSELKILLF